MRTSIRLMAIAALCGALAASPASAQGWRDDGYAHGWRDHGWRDREWNRRAYRDDDYGVDTGIRDFAVCPGGYRLGRSGRLCWPD